MFLRSYQEAPTIAASPEIQRNNFIWAFNMSGIRPETVAGNGEFLSKPDKGAYELAYICGDKKLAFSMVFTGSIEAADAEKFPNAETHFRLRVASATEPIHMIERQSIELNYTILNCHSDMHAACPQKCRHCQIEIRKNSSLSILANKILQHSHI